MVVILSFLGVIKDVYNGMGQMACLEFAFKYSGKKNICMWGVCFGVRLGCDQRQMKQDGQHTDNYSSCWVLTLSTFVYI